jgi:hypothetical protein
MATSLPKVARAWSIISRGLEVAIASPVALKSISEAIA